MPSCADERRPSISCRGRLMARSVTCLSFILTFLFIAGAKAADTPVIESVADAASGTVLWQRSNSDAAPTLKPGQAIILHGHGFGTGPITAARPGLDPPAGGTPPVGGAVSVVPSVAEPADLELSKILFGNVRAMERNLSSYRARIDLESAASAVLSKIQNTALTHQSIIKTTFLLYHAAVSAIAGG